MRISALRAAALLLAVTTITPAARADENESTAVTIMKAAGSSAAGKGAEFAVKLIGSAIFDASCKDKVLQGGDRYICDALGAVSGRTDDEWKQKVEQQLGEINSKLGTLQKGQDALRFELKQQHSQMTSSFDQAAAKVEATHAIVRIENLWDTYLAQFDRVDADVEREAMVALAKDIIANKIHTKLGDLNVVLTKSTLDGQPLLRYPFYTWRMKRNGSAPPHQTFDAAEIYDFAEKKFMDFRYQQHKAYVMYLWAAAVLESDCVLNPSRCVRPPRSAADFRADYVRYTRQQVEAFNAGVDWLVLSYALPRNDDPRTLAYGPTAEMALTRANFLSASMLTNGEGWWGRVISMGDAWDGTISVQCPGANSVLKPVLQYAVPVEDQFGKALDWWVARKTPGVYDEVRFSNEWKIYQYHLPQATPGGCTYNNSYQNARARLAWQQNGNEVVTVQTADGKKFPFGSFIGVQRAGGTYALASGTWTRPAEPLRIEDGPGAHRNVRFEWAIETRGNGAPWMSLITEGDGEWTMKNLAPQSSRVRNRGMLFMQTDKSIRFPEGGTMRLGLSQAAECLKTCRNGEGGDFLMDYDIWNNDSPIKYGYLNARTAVYFKQAGTAGDPKNGIFIDGSYPKTGEQKRFRASGAQSGAFTADPAKEYHLRYLIEYEMETEGEYTNRTHWMYRAKIIPYWLYVTK